MKYHHSVFYLRRVDLQGYADDLTVIEELCTNEKGNRCKTKPLSDTNSSEIKTHTYVLHGDSGKERLNMPDYMFTVPACYRNDNRKMRR